jgi:hypothetical protein
MSAEVPTPDPETPPARSRVVSRPQAGRSCGTAHRCEGPAPRRALAILEHDVLLLIGPGGKNQIACRAEEKEDRRLG